ncbi:MAG: peptidylprolyl isomerase [Bacteroidota bacterium]
MAIITSIRKHSGLVVILVGVAIFSFVLSDMLFKGKFFFQSEQTVGKIGGTDVSIISFDNEVQRIADIQKERKRENALDEETMSAIRDNVWNKFVNELALNPNFVDAGISVTNTEIKDIILGNDPDPMVINYFTDPANNQIIPYFRDQMTGKLKASSIKTYVDSLPDAEKYRWAEFEELLRNNCMQTKYLTLIKKGLYITSAQIKNEYAKLNRKINFKYVFKPYSSLTDSLVKVTEDDMLKYYDENKNKFKQDASRKLEYVVFDVKPVEQDFEEVKSQMEKLAEEWKQIGQISNLSQEHGQIKNHLLYKEDSLFVIRESDSRWFDTTKYGKGLLPLAVDSLAHISEAGTVFPLYSENNIFKLCKVMDYVLTPDSVKARHILIKVPEGDTLAKAKTKIKIDSLKKIIEKQKNFADLAKKFCEDGTKEKGGDLGWFTIGKMTAPFEYACFHNKKGNLFTVNTEFGWHIVEIMEQSRLTRKTQLATIDRSVLPGSKTRQDIYNKTSDFITQYHTSETYQKGIEEKHLISRVVQLRENDKVISGIENPRDIIRWAFNAEEGAISTEPFSFSDKYVITHLAEIREEGIAPMKQKKEEVEMGTKKNKKAESFINEIKNIKASSLDEYAIKMKLTVQSVEASTFSSPSISGIGREPNLLGILFSMKQGQLSAPIKGESGVYIVKIESIKEPPAINDYSDTKLQAKNNFSYRADAEVTEALKKKAQIKDNRAKFY